MRDYLLDIVQHTVDVGSVDLVKIHGDDKSTSIYGIGAEQVFVLLGKFKNPVAGLTGTLGMPNLPKLKTVLNLPIYREDCNITVSNRQIDNVPEFLHFETAAGDFRNSYRFMDRVTVDTVVPDSIFQEPTWNVDFMPTESAIQRFRMQAQANAEQPHFQIHSNKDRSLKITFGSPTTHSGAFVFNADVGYTLKRARNWPAAQVLSILSLPGDKHIKIADDGGAMMIEVDSGLADYRYIIPAQAK
jgi:hypothetical protein